MVAVRALLACGSWVGSLPLSGWLALPVSIELHMLRGLLNSGRAKLFIVQTLVYRNHRKSACVKSKQCFFSSASDTPDTVAVHDTGLYGSQQIFLDGTR